MTTIFIKEGEPIDSGIRRFRRAVQQMGLLAEVRARMMYEKPTSARKRKRQAAIGRTRKRLARETLAPKLY